MSDRFMRFQNTITERKRCYAEYCAASAYLEVAGIKEREAEIGSQAFEHIAQGLLLKRFGEITEREMDVALMFARYVVYGSTDLQ